MFLDKIWYRKTSWSWFLWPLSCLYGLIFYIKRAYIKSFTKKNYPVPIIVVGNLTVGGVGKTPLVIAIASRFKAAGLRVGIVSRGYRSACPSYPYEIQKNDAASQTGDEPLLIFLKTACPVIIAPKRGDAVQYLIDKYQPDVIISDDGLQHDAMGRAVEIVVIDGERWFGNGYLLPAGPMRELSRRLKTVDFVIKNTHIHALPCYPDVDCQVATSFFSKTWEHLPFCMKTIPGKLRSLQSGHVVETSELELPIAAFAGIAHPERFFNTLTQLGCNIKSYAFKDHHYFKPQDFLIPEKTVVMTEKDAVKCMSFVSPKMFVLPIEAEIDEVFWHALMTHKRLEYLFKQ